MKAIIKRLSIIALLLGISLIFAGCDMDHQGCKVTFFEITDEIYYGLDNYSDPDEKLAYVKAATKTKGGTYWCDSPEGLRDFLNEKCGYLSNMNAIIQEVSQNRIVTKRYRPGILSTVDKLYFFYIKNNEL